jgi:dynactin 1
VDVQEQLEMAMLDKEVAEEKAEISETELETLREQLAVAEVELGVLKQGGGRTVLHNSIVSMSIEACPLSATAHNGDAISDAKSSLNHIQLEKQNERLKEALIRFVTIGLSHAHAY